MKGGTFRRIADNFKRLMGRPVTTHYPDPVFIDPRERLKKRAHGVGSGRFTEERTAPSARPPCEPGTITFHDKLVRYYGRRMADQFGRDMQHKDELGNYDRRHRIPTDASFAALTPWAWRA